MLFINQSRTSPILSWSTLDVGTLAISNRATISSAKSAPDLISTRFDLNAGEISVRQVGKLEVASGSLVLTSGADQTLTVSDITLMPHETPLHTVEEHTQRVTDLMDAMRADFAANDKLQFSLKGEDASFFSVSSKGVLFFKDAPDYQIQQDANLDGQYDVTVVAAQDNSGQSVEKNVSVCVLLVEMQGTDDNDVLKSGNAWDVIDGLAGDDRLTGGGGRDMFVISAGRDQITDFNFLGKNGVGAEVLNVQEGASVVATLKAAWTATSESINQGTALIQTLGFDADLSVVSAGIGWTLQALGKVNVHLTGSAGDDILLGANGADQLVGGQGDDWLAGGKGTDELTGGAGADTFVMSDTNGGKSIDRVTDFESGVDHLRLEGVLFKAPSGVLQESQFSLGFPQDANDRAIYNEQTGQLFWDADGSGRKAAILIAQFDPFDIIRASDILIG